MARELFIDPFAYIKEFEKPTAAFDPHKLPLMSSIWPSVAICCVYLLILKIGPLLMRYRKPFQLRTYLSAYNIFQVLCCIYFISNIFRTGFEWNYLWKCYFPGFHNPSHTKLLYFAYLTKLIELSETICFVLRKKFNQMSFLHIYHHVSTLLFAYFGVTRMGTGMLVTAYVLNFIVHSIMYSYYFASIRIKNIDKIVGVKKSITIMQMVQFAMILFNTLRYYVTNCGIHSVILAFFIPNVILIFYEFYQFYQKAYVRKETGKPKKQKRNWEAHSTIMQNGKNTMQNGKIISSKPTQNGKKPS